MEDYEKKVDGVGTASVKQNEEELDDKGRKIIRMLYSEYRCTETRSSYSDHAL